MAYEIKPWKKDGCSLGVKVAAVTTREPYSREINEAYGEGGALNATYATVEAVAKVTNFLGFRGFLYEIDFVYKTGNDSLVLDACDETMRRRIAAVLQDEFGDEVFAAA